MPSTIHRLMIATYPSLCFSLFLCISVSLCLCLFFSGSLSFSLSPNVPHSLPFYSAATLSIFSHCSLSIFLFSLCITLSPFHHLFHHISLSLSLSLSVCLNLFCLSLLLSLSVSFFILFFNFSVSFSPLYCAHSLRAVVSLCLSRFQYICRSLFYSVCLLNFLLLTIFPCLFLPSPAFSQAQRSLPRICSYKYVQMYVVGQLRI